MNNELKCYSIFITIPLSVNAGINKCICKDFCFWVARMQYLTTTYNTIII